MERNLNRGRNGNYDVGPIAAEADSQNWLRGMQRKIGKMPTLLSETAGSNACCIFRVPESLVEINAKAYKPRIVSIGPYHHGQEHLRMIQEHKWRFLGALLTRKEDDGTIISHCFQTVASLEMNIRECYSDQTNKLSGQDFVEMMVLDGCFIIELICKFTELVDKDPDDPIFKMDWVIPFLMRDLLKLENQIPFFVLQTLFDILVLNSRRSFACLALKFFSYMLERPPQVLDGANSFHGKHLLDLVRLSFCPSNQKRLRADARDKLLRFIQPAEKLHRAGIRFKTRNDADSFLDIKFSNGVLGIPPLPMDDFISSFLLNCVAFEQCHANSHKYITHYATFMGCLVHTPSDAGFLCDHKIIQNCFGTDDEIACFFSNVGKDVAIDIRKSYLSRLIEDVNEYYWNDWHVRWASFRHKYFDSPWSFMSACAALLLLILTSSQTFFAAYSYVRPPNSDNK